jgi:hypothetical protein
MTRVGPNSWLAMLSLTLGRRRTVPHPAAEHFDAGSRTMGNDTPGQVCLGASREGDQQCLIRDVNEATERLNAQLTNGTDRLELRCECGDPACRANVTPTAAEYEAVRSYGSHFIVQINHENPETASVIRQNESFAVVDVVAGDARYQVLARNPRHAWVDAVIADDSTGQPPVPERSPE